MNKPRIFPKSLKIEGSNFNMCKFSKLFISVIGYVHKSSENQSYTVSLYKKCQQAEISGFFVTTSIFTFSHTTDVYRLP